jgi:outer membrane murein-binding lipoprotein Lpp
MIKHLFTGWLMSICDAEVKHTPLNSSVIYIKQTDVVLTSDEWKAIINFDLAPYEDATGILRTDLTEVEQMTKQSTPIGEVQRVRTALDSLDSQLENLKRFMPKADRRRGLINAAGSLLQVLFGTATEADMNNLHSTVDMLNRKQNEIVHPVNQQVTYFKQLDGTVRLNNQAKANWSSIFKDFALRTQEKLQKVVSKLEWTLMQREAANAVKEIESALMQLELDVEELLEAFQTLMMGRIPVNLISFNMLHEILKNVSLSLPEDYELLMGLHFNKLRWYFQNVQDALIADLHSFKLVLFLPLISVNRCHEKYRIIALTTRFFNGTYVQFQVQNRYFAINAILQTYFTMTEDELMQCKGSEITICPAGRPISSTKLNSCELSLYLQTPDATEVCTRTISAKAPSPHLQSFGTVTLYFLPEKSQVSLRCHSSKGWEKSSLNLQGVGMITGAGACHITAGGLQLFAELHGVTEVQLPVPQMVYHSQFTVTSDGELEALREISKQQDIGKMIVNNSVHRMEVAVSTLVKLHPLTSTHPVSSKWTTPVLITVAVVLVLLVCYQIFHYYPYKFMICCTRGKSPDAAVHTHTTPNQSSYPAAPGGVRATPAVPDEEATRQPTFSKYEMHQDSTH